MMHLACCTRMEFQYADKKNNLASSYHFEQKYQSLFYKDSKEWSTTRRTGSARTPTISVFFLGIPSMLPRLAGEGIRSLVERAFLLRPSNLVKVDTRPIISGDFNCYRINIIRDRLATSESYVPLGYE